ncbi:MAG: VOC family protein [Bacteroidota bacterium]
MKAIVAILSLMLLACQSPATEEASRPEVVEVVEPPSIGPTQMSFDHQALIVRDLETAVEFYENTLGLEQIYNATEKAHIRWFDLGNGTGLHVIESEEAPQVSKHKSVHLALTVANFDEFVESLLFTGVPFEDWPGNPGVFNYRPDSVRQVYFQDLDGYWFEVNDAISHR